MRRNNGGQSAASDQHRTTATARRRRACRPLVEALEVRPLLSSIIHNSAYDGHGYQPLNGDTQYTITGQLIDNGASNPTVNVHSLNDYSVYLTSGSTVTLSLHTDSHKASMTLTTLLQSLLTTGYGSNVTETYHVQSSGVYYISLSTANYPYPHPYTQSYTLQVAGTASPELHVPSLNNSGVFYITAQPSMPTIDFQVTGITPDPLATTGNNLFNVNYSLTLSATTNPYNIPPKSLKGQVSYFAGPTFEYRNDPLVPLNYYALQFLPGSSGIVGGKLEVTVDTIMNGKNIQLYSNDVTILGMNPTASAVKAYINAKPTPTGPNGFPAKSGYDYHTILRQIAGVESNGLSSNGAIYHQFSDLSQNAGWPYFNSNGATTTGPQDGGVGIMQITPDPKSKNIASISDIWNWHTNVDDGVALFKTKLAEVSNYTAFYEANQEKMLASQIKALRVKNGLSSLSMEPLTAAEVVRAAIRRYNGGFEFTPARDKAGNLIVTMTGPKTGVIAWVENYGAYNYVPKVLSHNS
jgi:hypothetical protein